MKQYLEREWRRISEEMGHEHQPEVLGRRGLGDALALCLAVVAGAMCVWVC